MENEASVSKLTHEYHLAQARISENFDLFPNLINSKELHKSNNHYNKAVIAGAVMLCLIPINPVVGFAVFPEVVRQLYLREKRIEAAKAEVYP